MARTARSGGVSLAKGPAGIIGIALLAYGITGLIFGGNGFTAEPVDGTVNGSTWLGLEGNGWTNVLFAGSGALLLFGAPLHWGAKTLALVVGLVLGAASVISLVDGQDVFGIFAANGLTKLVWGVAAAVLLVVALLPRVGKDKHDHRSDHDHRRRDSSIEVTPRDRFDRDTDASRSSERVTIGDRPQSRIVAPADGTTPESRETTRRQHTDGRI
jgi:hypothetical protein